MRAVTKLLLVFSTGKLVLLGFKLVLLLLLFLVAPKLMLSFSLDIGNIGREALLACIEDEDF